jgi:hypothetical protein
MDKENQSSRSLNLNPLEERNQSIQITQNLYNLPKLPLSKPRLSNPSNHHNLEKLNLITQHIHSSLNLNISNNSLG